MDMRSCQGSSPHIFPGTPLYYSCRSTDTDTSSVIEVGAALCVHKQSSESQALKNLGHYDLVRVGADGVNFNTAFAKNLLGLMRKTSFYNPTLTHVGNRNSWYQTHSHQSLVGKYIRDNVSKNRKLDEQDTIFNGCTEYGINAAYNKVYFH